MAFLLLESSIVADTNWYSCISTTIQLQWYSCNSTTTFWSSASFLRKKWYLSVFPTENHVHCCLSLHPHVHLLIFVSMRHNTWKKIAAQIGKFPCYNNLFFLIVSFRFISVNRFLPSAFKMLSDPHRQKR